MPSALLQKDVGSKQRKVELLLRSGTETLLQRVTCFKKIIWLLMCPFEATELGLCQNMTVLVWTSCFYVVMVCRKISRMRGARLNAVCWNGDNPGKRTVWIIMILDVLKAFLGFCMENCSNHQTTTSPNTSSMVFVKTRAFLNPVSTSLSGFTEWRMGRNTGTGQALCPYS